MVREAADGPKRPGVELVTFFLGENLFGIDIGKVRGINRVLAMVPVELAPNYVRGLMSLRGQIVTVLDLNRKLGLMPAELTRDSRIVIVIAEDENIGLLVDRVNDVMRADEETIELPPANLGGVQSEFVAGVFKAEADLVGILDVGHVLQAGEDKK